MIIGDLDAFSGQPACQIVGALACTHDAPQFTIRADGSSIVVSTVAVGTTLPTMGPAAPARIPACSVTALNKESDA